MHSLHGRLVFVLIARYVWALMVDSEIRVLSLWNASFCSSRNFSPLNAWDMYSQCYYKNPKGGYKHIREGLIFSVIN